MCINARNDRVMITGTNSGSGKTTVTIALLSALKARGLGPNAYKCGPDYIDPMFHRHALGIPSHNLDAYFCTGDQLRSQLARATGPAIIEGVMGYYDGIGTDGYASSYEVARLTGTPAILVINAKGMYTSSGAIMQGFRDYRPDSHIEGVIFNNVSAMVYKGLAEIAREAGIRPLGYLPNRPELAIESRHLGLVTADEIEDLDYRLEELGKLAEECLDIQGILELAGDAMELRCDQKDTMELRDPEDDSPAQKQDHRVRVAVAQDDAFCFVYEENLELLRELGADLVPFSPIHDSELPENIHGLYLPGGYPELHTEELSANIGMKTAIKRAIQQGLPTIAECGGFLYLHETLDGASMVGLFPADAGRTEKLQRFGYVELEANEDNLLCRKGERIRAHEFHYYDSRDNGAQFTATKASTGRQYACSHASKTLYAGFPHLYFPANPTFAENYMREVLGHAAE